MKHLMLTTALVAASAIGVSAQSTDMSSDATAPAADAQVETNASGSAFRSESNPEELRASDFIGMRVFAAAEEPQSDAFEGAQDNWEDIGEINDVILSREGEVQAILVDIGGFLGIGERQVAVNMDSIDFVSDSSTEGAENDFFLVLTADRAILEGAPAYGSDSEEVAGDATAPVAGTSTDMAATDSADSTEETTDTAASEQPVAEESSTDMAATDSAASTEETTDTAASEQPVAEESSTDMAASDSAASTEETTDTAASEEPVTDESSDVAATDDAASTNSSTDMAASSDAASTDQSTDMAASSDTAASTDQSTDMAASSDAASTEETTDTAASEEPVAETESTDMAATDDAASTEESTDVAATDDAASTGESTDMAASEEPVAETDSTDMAATDGAATEDATATDGAATGMASAPTPEGYSEAGDEFLTAEALDGARVYDANDKWVGEISELLLDDSGKITDAVVDVGGFLGIGEKPVALQLSDLKILKQDETDSVRVYTAMAEEELEAMPEFEAPEPAAGADPVMDPAASGTGTMAPTE